MSATPPKKTPDTNIRMSEDNDDKDWLESLDRAVQEVEALQAIYQEDDDAICLVVKSPDLVDKAKELVEAPRAVDPKEIPTLELEMKIQEGSDVDTATTSTMSALLYFGLPPGYPSFEPVKVTVLTAEGLAGRLAREELSRHLQAKARELTGAESIMELTQECQEQLMQLRLTATSQEQQDDSEDRNENAAKINPLLGRRWIWVHHIKDRQRKEDIVREAQERKLGGYLKAGYPGIVVIEGNKRACDEFVMWIKGNKSRPGGFGRQWGHHVRGELEITQCQLPDEFVALEEDMSILASLCREKNLEEEFLKFVMQHG